MRHHHTSYGGGGVKGSPVPGFKESSKKLWEARAEIAAGPPSSRFFAPRFLVTGTLPHQDPGDVPLYERRNGTRCLRIQPGIYRDGDQYKSYGVPSGAVARLLILWITTQVVFNRGKERIEAETLAPIIARLGLSNSQKGSRGARASIRRNLTRLRKATVTLDFAPDDPNVDNDLSFVPIARVRLHWFQTQQADQPDGTIQLTPAFARFLRSGAFPVDPRAIRAIHLSPLAIDLYLWIASKIFRANAQKAPITVPWRALTPQLGHAYSKHYHFVTKAREVVNAIKIIHPDAGIELKPAKIVIMPGPLLYPFTR